MSGEHLTGWWDSVISYGQEYPLLLLLLGGLLAWLLIKYFLANYRPGDQIKREFRKAGIYPSEQQAETLRNDFARIAAESARKGLEERLKHQAAMQRDKEQVARVAEIANAHVAVVRDLGATLQALELEYLKYRKSLSSEQAKEAMRLIVEKAVAQVTEIAGPSSTNLPSFVMGDGKTLEAKLPTAMITGGEADSGQSHESKMETVIKFNGAHALASNGDVGHY